MYGTLQTVWQHSCDIGPTLASSSALWLRWRGGGMWLSTLAWITGVSVGRRGSMNVVVLDEWSMKNGCNKWH